MSEMCVGGYLSINLGLSAPVPSVVPLGRQDSDPELVHPKGLAWRQIASGEGIKIILHRGVGYWERYSLSYVNSATASFGLELPVSLFSRVRVPFRCLLARFQLLTWHSRLLRRSTLRSRLVLRSLALPPCCGETNVGDIGTLANVYQNVMRR